MVDSENPNDRSPLYSLIVADNVKRALTARGWTRDRLVEETGISISFITAIISGLSNPSLKNLVKLADAFDVEPADLLEPHEDAFPPGLTEPARSTLDAPPPGYERVTLFVAKFQLPTVLAWQKIGEEARARHRAAERSKRPQQQKPAAPKDDTP